ncbi:MAG: YheT family hydrolase [Pseudohongiellaceae bacterium]
MTTGTLQSSFKSAWWLPEGHTQTLWRKFTASNEIKHRRQRVNLKDGDFIDLDWHEPENSNSISSRHYSAIAVLIHGLCGCSLSPYVVALQKQLAQEDIASVAINLRGCSGEENNLARAYHSGVSEDLNEVFNSLQSEYPNTQFMFIGYSLGANVLLKWLGESETDERVSKAVAVSTPFQLDQCSQAMLRGPSSFYGSYFVNKLREDISNKISSFGNRGLAAEQQKLLQLGKLEDIKSIWEFDDQVTAPLHGFGSAQAYYDQCSSRQFLKNISANTLLIQSKNDPLIPEIALPKNKELSASVSFELAESGGHVGFVSGGKNNWLEQRIVQYLIG